MKTILYTAGMIGIFSLYGAEVRPSLAIDFDGDFDGRTANGVIVKGVVRDGARLTEGGLSGKALLVDKARGHVDFPVAGVLSADEGTIELWVKPLDWLPTEETFHVFAETQSPEGWLILYKYYKSQSISVLTAETPRGALSTAGLPILDWKPGQWYQVAATWSKDGIVPYVNGKTYKIYPVANQLPRKLGEFISIGDRPWDVVKRNSSSLIDRVRFYPKALTKAQIAENYHRARCGGKVVLDDTTARLEASGDPRNHTVTLHASTGGADLPDSELQLRLSLQPQEMDASAKTTTVTVPVRNGEATHTFPLPEKPGRYNAAAVFLRNGKELAKASDSIVRPDLSWRGNPLGTARKVLKPWTPLVIDRNTVQCWGRTYELGQTGLPRAIFSKGENLLAAPVVIEAEVKNTPVNWISQTLTPQNADGYGAQWSGRWIGAAAGERVQLEFDITIEFDGFLDITVKSPDAAKFSQFSLIVPVKADHALYRHRYCTTREGTAGWLPPGEGVVDRSSFLPFAWLGDNDRGLFWCSDSSEFWPNAESADAFECVRRGDRVEMRFHLLRRGQRFPDRFRWNFALQATPVKPVPRANGRDIRIQTDGRNTRFLKQDRATMKIEWSRPFKLSYYGYPEVKKNFDYRKLMKERHQQGVRVLQYLGLSCQASNIPEFDLYGKFWQMGYVDSMSADVARFNAVFTAVAPGGLDYADFITYKTHQFMTETGLDGLYHDNAFVYESRNGNTPYGYERNNRRHTGFSLFDNRKLYRRVMAMTSEIRQNPFNMAHMSSKMAIPMLAYHDATLDGEHFSGRVGESYSGLLTLDALRAEYMGRQWGIIPYFLPEFRGEHAKAEAPTRELMTMLMLHDIRIIPDWCNVDVVNTALDALDSFGYAESDFIGYFDARPLATTALPETYISGYRKDNGDILLVIGNLSKQVQKGAIRLNRTLPTDSKTAVSGHPDGREFPLNADGTLEVTLEPRSYRLLKVEGR